MDASAPVLVAAGASRGAPSASPPPIGVGDPASASGGPEIEAAPSIDPVQAPEAPPFISHQSMTGSTPRGSPARLTAATITEPDQQQVTSTQDQPMTPETASSERSASDDVQTPTESEKGVQRTQMHINQDQNGAPAATNTERKDSDQTAAQQEEEGANTVGNTTGDVAIQTSTTSAATDTAEQAAPGQKEKRGKMWFDVLPMVLQNFKTHGREQIRQLMLPRCELCERGKVDKEAEVKCSQEGCILLDCALCSSCWRSTHSSEGARRHRRLPASICPQCHLERIAYWCAECDLKFCTECFEQIHSVPRAKTHRKLATEDAPGTCLAKSHWSANFQNVIFQLVAARKRPFPVSNGSSGGNVGDKRKRDIEVIVIDDEEEENETAVNNGHGSSSLANGTAERQAGNGGRSAHQQNECAFTQVFSQFQTLQQPASALPFSQAPVAQHSMIEPIPFPQDLTETTSTPLPSQFEAVQTSSAYNTPNGTNTVNISSRVDDLQWNDSAAQFGAPASMGSGSSSTIYATSGVSNGMVQVSPASMLSGVTTTSGPWSTTSAISTDLASTSNPNNLLPLGGAVFAENALVDSLVDRYHEVNQNVMNMELQTEQLTRQIAVASCQGPYAAAPIMVMLRKLQAVLDAARTRRDKLFIAMVIQSHDIMASVRLLRLTELGDVPQVPMISHRKCLQISDEINQHKKQLIELNQQLSETLNQSHAVSSSWENTLIRTTSAKIQMHEERMRILKKDREVEIVRIVQFSLKIREALKHAFQWSVEAQRQQRQQLQPYG